MKITELLRAVGSRALPLGHERVDDEIVLATNGDYRPRLTLELREMVGRALQGSIDSIRTACYWSRRQKHV